ncbi:DUF1353 domain-containing protein [Pseudomonas azerbaijanoccidentalis]
MDIARTVQYASDSISSTTPALTIVHEYYGRYEGSVIAKWHINGRDMELVQPFRYFTVRNIMWDAPEGSIVDGASIPRFAWPIIGGPFEGKYREASVIHDVACQRRVRPWQDVHLAFYTAMLTSGVDQTKAKIMYGAVYFFGPRWSRTVWAADISPEKIESVKYTISQTNKGSEKAFFQVRGAEIASADNEFVTDKQTIEASFVPLWPTLSTSEFEALRKKIELNNLSLDEIRNYQPQSNL